MDTNELTDDEKELLEFAVVAWASIVKDDPSVLKDGEVRMSPAKANKVYKSLMKKMGL